MHKDNIMMDKKEEKAKEKIFIHPSAEVSENASIGEGSKIWHQAQVRENAKIGKNCIIGKNVYIDFGVQIGDNCKIQNNVNVYHGVSIEDEVFLGPGMTFTNDLYPRAFIWSEDRVVKTVVKKGASIGANATIICGVTIGSYALVGAGSVVTKDVPPHALVVGNPARVLGFVCKCGWKLEVERKEKNHILMLCPKCGKKVKIPLNDYLKLEK